MENQSPPITPTPGQQNQDDSNSLEGTSTVVESSATVTPGSGGTAPKQPLTSTPAPPKRPSLLRRVLAHGNIYLIAFIVILLIAIGIIVFAIFHNNKPPNGPTANSQTLSASEFNNLAGSSTVVGTPQQNLTFQSNATFSGAVLIKNDLSVAGTLKLGGTLNLPGILVSGTSNFGTVQANNLTVTGDVIDQGNMTVQKSLSVAGSANFSGVLSASQVVTQNLQLENDLQLSRHIDTIGSTPSRSEGSALGSGGTASVSGTDTAGTVTINTGGSPGAGCFVTINFTEKFSNTPHIVITPVGSAAAGLGYYINRSTTNFSICTVSAAGAGESFSFDYIALD